MLLQPAETKNERARKAELAHYDLSEHEARNQVWHWEELQSIPYQSTVGQPLQMKHACNFIFHYSKVKSI